jgi:hypothetical protein
MRNSQLPNWLLSGALVLVATLAVWIGLHGMSLTFKSFSAADILRLLASLGVVALFVERTIEVFVGAWRGEVTEKLFSAAESAKLALISAPFSITLYETAALRDLQLTDYRARTKTLALRTAVVMGLVVAATGFRTLETLVIPPVSGASSPIFRLMDLAITSAAIGGEVTRSIE